MKIAKLLSMMPVLIACLALAAVPAAQVGCVRSKKKVLGTVSLRKGRNNEQIVKVFLETNGVLSLGDKRVEKIYFGDGSVYFPGKSSDKKEIKIGEDGKMRVGGVTITKIYLEGEE